MVLFAVEVGSPQINVRERGGSKVAYGFAAGGLPDYDTTSPALPSRQGHSLRRAELRKLSSSGGEGRPWLEHAVVGPQPQQDHGELAGHANPRLGSGGPLGQPEAPILQVGGCIGSTATRRPRPDRCAPARRRIWKCGRRDRSRPRADRGRRLGSQTRFGPEIKTKSRLP